MTEAEEGLMAWKSNLCQRLWKEEGDVLALDEEARHQAISDRAYVLWQSAGSPPGDGMEFWLQAEVEVDSALFD